jgi:hypothetical protein
MTKSLVLAVSVLLSAGAFAQSAATTSSTDLSGSLLDSISKKMTLSLETEVGSQRNSRQDYEITGYTQYYRVEPGMKINSKNAVSIGADYMVREFNTEDERKKRDGMDNVFVKYTNKTASFKSNGIADVRLQARAYQTTDKFYKDFYGSDGNYQLRSYFGRPVVGNLYINKYTSYLRYKKYTANSTYGSRSRDYELRARINPTYRLSNGLDLGLTLTYNHIFTRDADEENVGIDLSARKQFDKLAVLFLAGYKYQDTKNDDGELAYNKDAPKDISYLLNLTYYVF